MDTHRYGHGKPIPPRGGSSSLRLAVATIQKGGTTMRHSVDFGSISGKQFGPQSPPRACSEAGGLRSRTLVSLRRIAPAVIVLVLLPIVCAAQPLLPRTLDLGNGISVSYPAGWSVAQPALNSWVILNVPADLQDIATPTVRVVIGYLERVDHAEAVSQ